MTDPPGSGFTVRVLDAAGGTAWVGVLVGPQQILTCAHVVNAALRRDGAAQEQPAGEVTVAFAASDGSPPQSRVQRWLPHRAPEPSETTSLDSF